MNGGDWTGQARARERVSEQRQELYAEMCWGVLGEMLTNRGHWPDQTMICPCATVGRVAQ